jgi:formylglycine-generating enzyme required for sulfatase activity
MPVEGEENPLNLTAMMPVMGISWFDAMAYCAWKSSCEGRVYTPGHEEEFEKAARGVDGRVYPWGDEYDGTYSNTTSSHETGMRIAEPGGFPVDESPYAAMGLAGNMVTWCLNAPEKQHRNYRCLRGGSWFNSPGNARAGIRRGNVPAFINRLNGVRLFFRPRAIHILHSNIRRKEIK